MNQIPVLRIGSTLLVSIQGELHDEAVDQLRQDLLDAITRHGADGVLIDVSSVTVVDSFVARMLAGTATATGILDATTVIVGIQPAVAITLVELGVTLPGIQTALNIDYGLRWLDRQKRAR